MLADIKSYAIQINNNTGIEFSIFAENGDVVYGENKSFPVKIVKSGSVLVDKEKNVTIFNINFNKTLYVGVLEGALNEQKNYAYLLAELFDGYSSKGSTLKREDFFRALIGGELDTLRIRKYLKKYGIEDKNACAMLITSNGKSDEIVEICENYSEKDVCFATQIDENQCVVVKYANVKLDEYHSATEFAEFLCHSIYEETGYQTEVAIGGTVESVVNVFKSYSQALQTKRMSSTMNLKKGVHTYNEFMLYHVLEELPEYKLNEFFRQLTNFTDKQIFSDAELIQTAEEFLENSLNVSETARKLYLHRNTLTYRLDKIENETGLNIRKFSDAVVFRLIVLLKNLIR